MVDQVFYFQPCPVCGRTLRIGVTLLGRNVYCQHCGGGFVAVDAALGGDRGAADVASSRQAAVDRLLDLAAAQLEQAGR